MSHEYLIDSKEYKAIQCAYGDSKAKRSQVPLINHINEGLEILNRLNADDLTKRAFCLHPLLQNDDQFKANWIWASEEFPTDCLILVMEYRKTANSYLCVPHTDHYTMDDLTLIIGNPIKSIRQMLIADKEQNKKDFLIHHYGKHERSYELNKYFDNWLNYLHVLEGEDV